jgi:glycosyltransferase involved in cell wall biosynthesis
VAVGRSRQFQNMHIVHVIVALEVGGAELMLSRLVTGESPIPLRHSVVSLTGLGTIGEQLRARNIEVRALGLSKGAALIQGFWRLRAALRELRPDVVHTWMYHADFLGGLAARSLGYKNVVWSVRTTHVEYETSRLTRYLARACGFLSRFIPRIIVCAAEASRRAHLGLGYDGSRMIVINNGFDVDVLSSGKAAGLRLRVEWGFGEETIAIGAAGRFTPVKDFKNFIDAAAVVSKSVRAARFLLVGRGLTEDNLQLMRWIREYGLEKHFVLLGERSDMPACLAALDVFCLSSRSEGFPNVVGEAMAAGLPCVVTDVGDAALLLGDGGIVVPQEDYNALGAALTRIAKLGAPERTALGAIARARIETQFSMKEISRRFAEMYCQVTGVTQGAR